MNNRTAETFDSRAFWVLLSAFSGIGLPVTGYANHLLGFEPMTLSRHVWMSAHNSLAAIFAVSVIYHILINGRAFSKYVSGLSVFRRSARLQTENDGAAASSTLGTRAWIALLSALIGIGLPITGYMNHLLGFESLTHTRRAWMVAHNGLGFAFSVVVIWHILLNRRALTRHLRGLAVFTRSAQREAFYAVAVVAVLLFVFVGHAFHVQ